jgi:glycerol-3-phosphate dehydrogenase (NAD(P)+)
VAQKVISILGGGSWGTALAITLSTRFDQVLLWVHNPDLAEAIKTSRENQVYLPGFRLPDNILVSSTMAWAPLVLSVTPSRHLREVLQAAARLGPARVISATKGIEAGSFLRMSEIAEACMPGCQAPAVLTGPTFAREVAAGEPAAVVIASRDAEFAQELQNTFSGANLRFYTNDDVVGVELAAALKNVIAIAAGAIEGLHLGSNSTAALITRGLAEISRLVVACGGKQTTVAGLAGLGDLVLTCTGQLSRNRRVGIELAKGRPIAEILQDSRMVAEGVETTRVAIDLSSKRGVEMPIAQAVLGMLDGRPARDALRDLVSRAPKAESL